MKITLSFSCFLAIFFFTLIIHSPPSIADFNDCNNFLCDENWDYVKTNKPYKISDISLESTVENNSCPRDAIMSKAGGDSYFVIKTIVPTNEGLVPLETPLAIGAAEKSECKETGLLRTAKPNKKHRFWHVVADGYFNASSSCFQFLQFPNQTEIYDGPSYQLQNCPFKCGRGNGTCFNIGKVKKGNYVFLTSFGTGGDLFEFSFEEKSETQALSYI